MDYDILKSVSQGSDGAQDAENSRIETIADELRDMVCEVNDTKVVPQERLSYNVYRYTIGGELEIA